MSKDQDKDRKRLNWPKWLNKRFVITIILIYVALTIAAFLWTTYVTGWGNWFI